MPVDIEYPCAGDAPPLNFPAGGTYTATAKSGPLPTGSKVVSKVYSSTGTLLDTKEDTTIGPSATGYWEVSHTLPAVMGGYENARIDAELIVGTAPDGTDSVEGIDSGTRALGVTDFSVIP